MNLGELFTVLSPPAVLSRDVECIRIATHAGNQPLKVKVCPSGYPGIVFQLATDRKAAIDRIVIRSAIISDIPVLFLHGLGSEPSIMSFKGAPYTTIQFVLKPHALFSLFGFDASEYNQGFLFSDQFGASGLEKQLQASISNDERINLLVQFLMKKKEQNHKRDELIEQTIEYIHEHIEEVSVKELVAAFFISERQLQKRFTRVVGMQPQLFIRIRRINEALRMMHSGDYERLSDIAYALNYYDQSHFIRDMNTFFGVSPKHITMKVSEFHNDLAGASYL